MRALPRAGTLREAVEEVIRSNRADAYPPTRFIQLTEHGNARDLKAIRERIIRKGATVEPLERALRSHPSLLTIEDFVARHSHDWGMSEDVIHAAAERARYFDQVAGGQRDGAGRTLMARMYPETLLDGADSEAEILLFNAFREQLPDDFVVLHSVKWLLRDARWHDRQGEADFIIAHPDLGVLVLEVKGGTIGVDGRTGQWWSNDVYGKRHEIKDPFQQASDSLQALRQKLEEVSNTHRFDYRLQHGVAFPDIRLGSEGFGPHAPRDLMIDASDLWGIETAVRRVLRRPPQSYRLSSAAVQALIDVLKPSRQVEALALGPQILRAERKIVELTRQQYIVLDALQRQNRAVIRGCAGSGKTMLAIEKARRLAREGYRVVFTCFNRNLANWIEAALTSDESIPAGSIRVGTFHRLAGEICDQAGVQSNEPRPGTPEEDVFYQYELPMLMIEALASIDERYDAIIIDEGQDFREEWQEALLALLGDPDRGIVYVFMDEFQAIYQSGTRLLRDAPTLELTVNCRNTAPIHQHVIQFHKGEPKPGSSGIPGPDPEVIELGAGDLMTALRKLFARLFTTEKIPPENVVILTPRAKSKSGLTDRRQVGTMRLSWDLVPQPMSVRVSTIQSFKGLESPIVILAELDQIQDWRNREELLYVGLSRARSHLFILGGLERRGGTLEDIMERAKQLLASEGE